MLRRLVREPLVHFLAAGAVLFALFFTFSGPQDDPADETSIVVDRDAILSFMQYRANAFEPDAFAALLDAMSEEELAALVDAYVEEEALFREAEALGLAESDYIIRQRMIQKMGFLLGDLAVAGEAIDETALAGYFETNREAYAVEPSVTFTHVFFDADRRGDDAAREAALSALAELEGEKVEFNDAPGRGDNFPFLRNYVERTLDYVASHFGSDFAEALASQPDGHGEPAWRGPIRSAFGWHVVLVTERTSRSLPVLADVREQLEADYRREQADAALKAMTATLRERYRVELRDIRGETESGAGP